MVQHVQDGGDRQTSETLLVTTNFNNSKYIATLKQGEKSNQLNDQIFEDGWTEMQWAKYNVV